MGSGYVFAEDQLWAKAIVEAGYAKAYADRARVFHSHEYRVCETLRPNDEARTFRGSFGYRLCPSIAHGLAQSLRCSVRDYRYLLSGGLATRFPEWLVKIPLPRLARQASHLIGAGAGASTLDKLFSLDTAKKRR